MKREGLTRLREISPGRQRTLFITAVLVSTVIFTLACLLPLYNQEMSTAYGYNLGGKDFYFPWYDSAGGKTWVMAAQPCGNVDDAINIFHGSTNLNDSPPIEVPQCQAVPTYFSGMIGGPIKVSSTDPFLLVSERSLFGNSFEEVWATPYEKLDSHYYWPWYDNVNMKNWVMVANPLENFEDVWVLVNVKGGHQAKKKLLPGEAWTPEFPGVMNGPVEVKAWRNFGSENNPADARKVIASQRVLWNGAFNEIPGIGASALDDYYVWTWYDDISPGADNWISVANPDPANWVKVFIVVGPVDRAVFYDGGWIEPNTTKNYRQPAIGGPVQIIASYDEAYANPAPIVATQRVLWGPSFSEIAGTSFNDTSAEYHWTWYDMKTPGVSNFIVISNLDDEPVNYEVRGAGDQYLAGGQIGLDGIAYPMIPGYIGGPIKVTGRGAWSNQPARILSSQRVLWNGYFNEVVGYSP